MVLASPAVPARKDQRAAVVPIIDAFFAGLGTKADEVLSANLDRAGARLVRLVTEEQRRFMTKPSYQEVVQVKDFDPVRATDKEMSTDRFGAFSRSVAYDDWERSLFPLEWFDSKPERTVANMVDTSTAVSCWIRLHTGELPILWNSAGQEYNPDLIVIEDDDTHWVVEVKMNKEIASEDVQGKREAARRWANYVSADSSVDATWKYLLVSESDVDTSKGSWDDAQEARKLILHGDDWYVFSAESQLMRRGDAVAKEWERLRAMTDRRKRGYQFESFVGSLFRRAHFSVMPSPGAGGSRQVDLLATLGDHKTYLIETKWWTKRPSVPEVRALEDRLKKTPPTVIGVLVSFSGFTPAAVSRVEGKGKRPISW